MYNVYILKSSKTSELYYGFTNNLKRRITEHNKRQSQKQVYYEAYKSEIDARNRERKLKHYAQALTVLKTRLEESLKQKCWVWG